MTTDFFQDLARDSQGAELPFLVVGGHAVNAYGYQRTTLDVDLLVPESSLAAWRAFWEERDYECFHSTNAFCQFQAKGKTNLFPIDLMVVSDETFEKLEAEKRGRSIGGTTLDVPAPLHLVTLKLHALRSDARAGRGQDIQDIVGLVQSCGLDIQSVAFQQALDRYADEDTKQEILRACRKG